MTLSFIVLAHTDAASLDRLLQVLSPYPVFLHVDQSAVKRGYFDRSNARGMSHVTTNLRPRCVHWGGYSIVRAMMETLAVALDEKSPVSDHIAFLSGQCFPLRPVEEFAEYIATASNAVHCRAFDLARAKREALGITRVTRRHWLDGPIGHLREETPRLAGGLARRLAVLATAPFPMRPPAIVHASGSQWVVVPRALGKELVAHYLRGGFDYLENAYAPDEIAVPSYVYNSDWALLTQSGQLQEWDGITVAPYPNYHWLRHDLDGLVDHSDVLAGLASGEYFVRKVSDSTSSDVMELLSTGLRT